LKLATSNLVHNLGLGLAYEKTTFWTKIGGGLGQGSSQEKCGTPYVFLQPLKLATSNLVHKLGLELTYQKTTFWTKIGGALSQGSIQKNWDPLRIFATVEASNFKFGTQIGLGTSLRKNNVLDQNWRGSGLREHPKKLGTPNLFLQPLKLATEKLVHNMSSGLPCQTQALGRVRVKRVPLPFPS